MVVEVAPALAAPFLCGPGSGWWPERVVGINAMHLFMGGILPWLARLDKLDADAELNPPSAQPRQAPSACGAKRDAVIDPDCCRQPVQTKHTSERRSAGLKPGATQQHHGKDITASHVAHSQGLHPDAIASTEPAFEVD